MADKIYDAYHQEIEFTDEQQDCLKYSGERTLIVKGYAGAGKSLVLMERARIILSKYGKDSQNIVAFFTLRILYAIFTISKFLSRFNTIAA